MSPATAKKPLVHYDTDRVVTIVGRDGDTWRVRYLDGREADVKADRVGRAMNSYILMEPGDLIAHGKDARGWTLSGRYDRDLARLEKLADDVAVWHAPQLASKGYLAFRTWDDLESWARRRLNVPAWTVDFFGGWVPVGDRRARGDGPLRPCGARFGCERPARPGEDLCGQHKAAHARAAQAAAARDERSREWREKWANDRAANASSAEWAQRIADEFKLRVRRTSNGRGNVEINPEGLYALLRSIDAEASWVIEELPLELQLRDDPEDSSDQD